MIGRVVSFISVVSKCPHELKIIVPTYIFPFRFPIQICVPACPAFLNCQEHGNAGAGEREPFIHSFIHSFIFILQYLQCVSNFLRIVIPLYIQLILQYARISSC